MGNNGMSFAIVIGVGGNGLIQAAQGQQQSIAVKGHGAQQTRPIK
jgi:hypothetical protein